MATLQTKGKEVVLEALADAALGIAIIDSTGAIVDAKSATVPEFAFSSASTGMTLDAPIVFDVPAGKTVSYIRIYQTPTPVNGSAFLDYGVLPGTTADRTFTYAGTYTLTGYTITVV